uniref:Uncharacterized protein n=1 Tax=Musca domestica TaxID=7370 RepID=T1P9B7_MUSDO
MELDQAITTAANNNNATVQYQKSGTTTKQKRTISTSSTSNASSALCVASANKAKRLNSELISIELKSSRNLSSGHVKALANNANNIIVVDSFDDVIVEEHEDDLTSSCSTTVEQAANASESAASGTNEDDQPKILDMQIYQHHDGRVDGGKSQISIVAENVGEQQQQVSTNVSPIQSESRQRQVQTNFTASQQPERQRQQQMECEVDAGFDETIVSEIDENTAIEYIEEDGAVTSSTLATSSSTTSTLPKVTTTYESTQSIAKEPSTESVTLAKALSCSGVSSTTNPKLSSLKTSNIGINASVTTTSVHRTNKELNITTETVLNNSTNPQIQQLQQDTQANNSGSTQVEP